MLLWWLYVLHIAIKKKKNKERKKKLKWESEKTWYHSSTGLQEGNGQIHSGIDNLNFFFGVYFFSRNAAQIDSLSTKYCSERWGTEVNPELGTVSLSSQVFPLVKNNSKGKKVKHKPKESIELLKLWYLRNTSWGGKKFMETTNSVPLTDLTVGRDAMEHCNSKPPAHTAWTTKDTESASLGKQETTNRGMENWHRFVIFD